MKTNQHPGRDPLDQVLAEWKVATPLPPRFQDQVWQRIAQGERRPTPATAGTLWQLLEAFLPRPQFAYAYLTALAVFGVAAGSWAAQIKNSHLDSQLSARYVQSIDPYHGDASER